MKHQIVRLVMALLTFSTGVGLHQLKSTRKSEKRATDLLYSRNPVVPASHFLFRGESSLSVSPRKPTLIFDYDPEKFWPVGDYAFTGKRPKGFSSDDSFYITIWQVDNSDNDYVWFSIFDERGDTDLTASFALVTERRLFFVTQPSPEGFVFRFDGEFLRRGVIFNSAEGEVVLKGTVTKSKNDRTVAEWPVRFKVIHDGC